MITPIGQSVAPNEPPVLRKPLAIRNSVENPEDNKENIAPEQSQPQRCKQVHARLSFPAKGSSSNARHYSPISAASTKIYSSRVQHDLGVKPKGTSYRSLGLN